MNYLGKYKIKKANQLLNYQRLLASVSHFDDVYDLDRQCLFVTVRYGFNAFEKLKKPTYFKLMNVFGTATFAKGPNRPGLIIEPDMAGSRTNRIANAEHHFHGLIVWPRKFNSHIRESTFDQKRIHDELETLKYDPEGYNRRLSVDVRPYEMDDCLGGLIDYSAKLGRKWKNEAFGSFFDGANYPWDMDLADNRLKPKFKSKQKARYDELYDTFLHEPHCLFSAEYMHHFGERLDELTALAKTDWRFAPNSPDAA